MHELVLWSGQRQAIFVGMEVGWVGGGGGGLRVQLCSEEWEDVMVDICPKLQLSGLGGDGFYKLRGSAASQSQRAVEKHPPTQLDLQFCALKTFKDRQIIKMKYQHW